MQNVSSNWKLMHQDVLIPACEIDISLELTDPDSITDRTSTANGEIFYSNSSEVVSDFKKSITPYATLEQNLWILDGSKTILPPTPPYGTSSFVGNFVSKEDGTYETNPILTISFSQVYTALLKGVTIRWATAYDEYPVNFVVTAYNGSAVVAQYEETENQLVESITELDIQNYDRITIEVKKWCLGNRLVRINDIFTGITVNFTKSDLISYTHEQEVDPLNAITPSVKINFSVENIDDNFDPNNPNGTSKYFIERQRLVITYGYEVNGEIEQIPAGIVYLSEWETPQNGLESRFGARDLLEFLRAPYTRGKYYPTGTSMYQLALDVFESANLPLDDYGEIQYTISNELRSIQSRAFLPVSTHAECLQYIAQASNCVLFADRNGKLHLEPINNAETDYFLSDFFYYNRPEIQLQKPLKDIHTKIYSYFPETESTEIFNGVVNVSGTQTVNILYSDPARNVNVNLSGGNLIDAVYYANSADLTISATGDVTVIASGQILKIANSEYSLTLSDNGETQTIENPLITSTEVASAVSALTGNYLFNRQELVFSDWRADPRMDALDIIKSTNKFGVDNVRMSNVKYTYTGAFHGSGKGRVI